jgi:nicotinamidase/pyrazinamidase
MKKALIVVDMLNDFVNEKGALQFPQARGIVDYVVDIASEFDKNDDDIILLRDAHEEDDLEFNLFPKHAVIGTWGSAIIEQLQKAVVLPEIIDKTRYSGFYGTNLESVLENINPDEVHVVGVCTSICVMDTVGGLANRDYRVIVHGKGVADFDNEAHKFSLSRMKNLYGAEIV